MELVLAASASEQPGMLRVGLGGRFGFLLGAGTVPVPGRAGLGSAWAGGHRVGALLWGGLPARWGLQEGTLEGTQSRIQGQGELGKGLPPAFWGGHLPWGRQGSVQWAGWAGGCASFGWGLSCAPLWGLRVPPLRVLCDPVLALSCHSVRSQQLRDSSGCPSPCSGPERTGLDWGGHGPSSGDAGESWGILACCSP